METHIFYIGNRKSVRATFHTSNEKKFIYLLRFILLQKMFSIKVISFIRANF